MQRYGQTTPSWFTVVVACPDGLHSSSSFSSFVPVSSPPSACTALHGSNSQIPISPDPVTGKEGRSEHTFPPEPDYPSVLIHPQPKVLPYLHPVANRRATALHRNPEPFAHCPTLPSDCLLYLRHGATPIHSSDAVFLRSGAS